MEGVLVPEVHLDGQDNQPQAQQNEPRQRSGLRGDMWREYTRQDGPMQSQFGTPKSEREDSDDHGSDGLTCLPSQRGGETMVEDSKEQSFVQGTRKGHATAEDISASPDVPEFCPAGVLLHASKSTDMSLSHLSTLKCHRPCPGSNPQPALYQLANQIDRCDDDYRHSYETVAFCIGRMCRDECPMQCVAASYLCKRAKTAQLLQRDEQKQVGEIGCDVGKRTVPVRKYDSILKALSSLENANIFLERTTLSNSVLLTICGLGSVWSWTFLSRRGGSEVHSKTQRIVSMREETQTTKFANNTRCIGLRNNPTARRKFTPPDNGDFTGWI
ncbi:hypothetical protein ANN_09870 [Periplaneta americana]|uniref:Uncharacterized protein n=1 Tax=Periplaneta americana TaxID=6978 RepID=A0ABQ8TNZ8_PERAM|nr:hypothetical protein ANN_09870 [Periplaneta americana]